MARARRTPVQITVRVAKIGSTVKEVLLETGATVEDALNAAEIDASGSTRMRISGEEVELDSEVEDGDLITLSGNIKNGL